MAPFAIVIIGSFCSIKRYVFAFFTADSVQLCALPWDSDATLFFLACHVRLLPSLSTLTAFDSEA